MPTRRIARLLRIDFLYPRDSVGPNIRLTQLPPRIADLGPEVHQACILLDGTTRPTSLEEHPGVRMHYISAPGSLDSTDPFRMRVVFDANWNDDCRKLLITKLLELIRIVKPDVIEVVDNAYRLGIEIQRITGIPTALLLCMHHITLRYLAQSCGLSYGWLLADFSRHLPHFNSVWSISNYFANFTKELCGLPRALEIPVRHNGVNLEEFQPLDISGDSTSYYRLLCLCRIDPEKGIHNLITALPLLTKLVSKRVHCTIAGDSALFPEYRSILEYIARQQGITCITFLGFITGREKSSLLQMADLYIFPTICPESGCMTVLEAMAAGTPLLVSKIGAAPEYLTESIGACFDPFNTRDLADRAAELLERKFSRHAIRQVACDNYSWARAAELTLSYFSNLV